ncbi:hypothetical protein SBA5_1140011 [Candidatus Sulfotelmatomonas gaucii]|uniref:Uncharacterized protein n=1 Tax=Candidatus Sulfuritelmatomonas gaucii TaxID=2043161 RepID=A0A2N9L3S7_9BACT|nr:hypothetical protein SBA5_1140011 [Candidatus Sulfotelmatomonas gaucii]
MKSALFLSVANHRFRIVQWTIRTDELRAYLASWGMYRGSTFSLQRAYTVHLGVGWVARKPF